MIFEYSEYRSYLRGVLADRITRNPGYSLRAFAKGIGIAPSFLCEVLKGSRSLSQQSTFKIGSKLGLNSSEAEYLGLLVQLESARSPELKEVVLKRIRTLRPDSPSRDLSVDAFKMIADWYHLPILELVKIPKSDLSPEGIASVFGITPVEAQAAVERLVRLEMLEKDQKGSIRREVSNWRVESQIPNRALRLFNRQMLSRAIEALETQSPQEKFTGSETFAFDPARLNEFVDLAEEFLKKASRLSAKSKPEAAVYHLCVHFFSLTQKRTKKGKL